MRAIVIAAALGLAGFVLSPSKAAAHEPTPSRHHGYGSSYYRGYYGARHDATPHWHRTYTPFGAYEWYGLGRHDFRPHSHVRTPFETRSYSYTPFGVTESIHPRYRAYPYYWR